MSKSNPSVAKTTFDREPAGEAAAKLSPEHFDERGRTVPWMARTMRRLYDAQGQKISIGKTLPLRIGITFAYWPSAAS